MKRSDALRPLSVEHHHGLVQVATLKQAVKDNTGLNSAAKNFLNAWDDVIEPHFLIEEEVIMPVYIKIPSHNVALVETFHDHHQQLRVMVNGLRDERNITLDHLDQLASLMKEHIRFEERSLFPEIETVLSTKQLNQAGQDVKERCTNYGD